MPENHSANITKAEQELAARFAPQSAPVDAAVSPDDLHRAGTNTTQRVTLANGATIDIGQHEPARAAFTVGENDPAHLVVSSEIDSIARRAEFLIETMERAIDPATGQPRPDSLHEYNRAALTLQGLQYSAAFQQGVALNAMRVRNVDARASGTDEMQREAAAIDQRTRDATAREFDRLFGPTVIR